MVNRAIAWISRRVPLLAELPPEVTAVSAVAFCVALGFGIVGPVIPAFAREFNVTAFAAGLVVSSFAFMRLISAPFAARLLDKIGERRVLSYGLSIVALSSFAAGLSQTYWQLLVLRSIGGIGSVMFSVSSLALLLRIVAPEQRGRAASAWSGGFLIGGLAGPVVGGVFVNWSLRAPFFVYAATLTLGVYVSWRSLAHAHLIADSVDPVSEPITLRAAARLRSYRAVVAAQFASGFVRFGITNALITLYIIEVLGAKPVLASFAFLLSSICQASLLSTAGRLTDRIGRRPVLLLGLAVSALSQAVLLAPARIELVLIAMATLGISGAFLSSAPSAIVGDVTHGHGRGPVVAVSQMASDFGGVVAPVVGGRVLDLTGSYPAAFATGIGMLVVALGFAIAMPETARHS